MNQKPSSRTNRLRPIEGLNLTPFIDIITCLMFFLLMFAAIIPVAMIDAPLPKVASTADEIKQAKEDKNKLEVIVYITQGGLRVKTDMGTDQNIPVENGKHAYYKLHQVLIQLHQKRPGTKEITLMPADDTNYETMIEVMDASRELRKSDPGYRQVPPDIAQKPESLQFNRLFPDVSIGGV